ncbi:hypothetical protein J4219_01815 [Candidatus Woesearchaeota archaeon]|nr:hypothetical protein [Candidatus Woesearchaeota archaeon]
MNIELYRCGDLKALSQEESAEHAHIRKYRDELGKVIRQERYGAGNLLERALTYEYFDLDGATAVIKTEFDGSVNDKKKNIAFFVKDAPVRIVRLDKNNDITAIIGAYGKITLPSKQ